MFRKLFRRNPATPARKQEAAPATIPSEPERPKTFHSVRENIDSTEAAFGLLVRERANGGNENREWNALIDWQNALIEALREYRDEVFIHSPDTAVLRSMFRFLWSAYDWCEHWEQGLDDLIYGDLARTAHYLEISLNRYGDFQVFDALKCEIGVKLSDLNDADKHTAKTVLHTLLTGYMCLSQDPRYVDPLIGQYWGWVNGDNPGGWRFRVNIVQRGREYRMFLPKNKENGPYVSAASLWGLLDEFSSK